MLSDNIMARVDKIMLPDNMLSDNMLADNTMVSDNMFSYFYLENFTL
jgi:hypothetical protein